MLALGLGTTDEKDSCTSGLRFVLRVGGQARKGELWEKEETRKEEKETRSFLWFLVEAAGRAFPAELPWSHCQLLML